jgi:hypothetical protein
MDTPNRAAVAAHSEAGMSGCIALPWIAHRMYRPHLGVSSCGRGAQLEIVVGQPISVGHQQLCLAPAGAVRAHARHRHLQQPPADPSGDEPDRQRDGVIVCRGSSGQDQMLDPVGMAGGEAQGVQPPERVADDGCSLHTDAIEQITHDPAHVR